MCPIRSLVKEPLFQFLIIAIVIVALDRTLSRPNDTTLIINQQLVIDLIKARSQLIGRELRTEEIRRLVDEFINDEILIREAYRTGLDRSDNRVRKQLLYKMRYALSEELAAPSEQQLKTFFVGQRGRYGSPVRYTFDHVYFNRESLSDDKIQDVLNRLTKGEDYAKLGDPFWVNATQYQVSAARLRPVFGAEFVKTLSSFTPHQWQGPVVSNKGMHFVRLKEILPAKKANFEEALSFLAQDYELSKQRDIINGKTATLREGYTVHIEKGAIP